MIPQPIQLGPQSTAMAPHHPGEMAVHHPVPGQALAQRISQMNSVRNPSLIPLNPGWFIGNPLLDYFDPQYIG